MTKLLWIRFFFRKTIYIISMSLLVPFIVQNCKIILTADTQLWRCSILDRKWLIFSKQIFFGKTINLISMHLWAPFIAQNLKKIIEPVQIYEDVCHFQAQNGPFAPNKNVLVKVINITFIYILSPFIVQNSKKKSYSGSRINRMRYFWPQNGPLLFKQDLFQKTCLINLVSHSCLSKFQKSKSDINLLMKYRQL